MWINDIEPIVFAKIKTEGEIRLKEKYPDIYFTTESKSTKEPHFPTVYVKKLQGGTQNQTLKGKDVSMILSSFQIDITDNTGDTVTQEVADVIGDIMLSMGYDVIGEPISDNDNDTYRNIARYRRLIGKANLQNM